MLSPRHCNSTRYAVCTTSAAGARRKRFSEIHEIYDNDTIYTSLSRQRRYVEEPKFDVFLNPTKRDKQEETLKNLTTKFQQVFQSMDMSGSYPALFQARIVDIGSLSLPRIKKEF